MDGASRQDDRVRNLHGVAGDDGQRRDRGVVGGEVDRGPRRGDHRAGAGRSRDEVLHGLADQAGALHPRRDAEHYGSTGRAGNARNALMKHSNGAWVMPAPI